MEGPGRMELGCHLEDTTTEKCSIIAGDIAYLLDEPEIIFEPLQEKLIVPDIELDRSIDSSSNSADDASIVEILSMEAKEIQPITVHDSSSADDTDSDDSNNKNEKKNEKSVEDDKEKNDSMNVGNNINDDDITFKIMAAEMAAHEEDTTEKSRETSGKITSDKCDEIIVSKLLSMLVLKVHKQIRAEQGFDDASDESEPEDDDTFLKLIIKNEEAVPLVKPKVKNEVLIEELPDEEEMEKIELQDSDHLNRVGIISGIVEKMIVIKADLTAPAVDADTALFLQDKTFIGKIFDTFGPVKGPFYSIRLHSSLDVSLLEAKTVVYFVPFTDQYTKYVFVEELKKIKGSDASGKYDCEDPTHMAESSDEETDEMGMTKMKNAQGGPGMSQSGHLKRKRDDSRGRGGFNRGNRGYQRGGFSKNQRGQQNTRGGRFNHPRGMGRFQGNRMDSNFNDDNNMNQSFPRQPNPRGHQNFPPRNFNQDRRPRPPFRNPTPMNNFQDPDNHPQRPPFHDNQNKPRPNNFNQPQQENFPRYSGQRILDRQGQPGGPFQRDHGPPFNDHQQNNPDNFNAPQQDYRPRNFGPPSNNRFDQQPLERGAFQHDQGPRFNISQQNSPRPNNFNAPPQDNRRRSSEMNSSNDFETGNFGGAFRRDHGPPFQDSQPNIPRANHHFNDPQSDKTPRDPRRRSNSFEEPSLRPGDFNDAIDQNQQQLQEQKPPQQPPNNFPPNNQPPTNFPPNSIPQNNFGVGFNNNQNQQFPFLANNLSNLSTFGQFPVAAISRPALQAPVFPANNLSSKMNDILMGAISQVRSPFNTNNSNFQTTFNIPQLNQSNILQNIQRFQGNSNNTNSSSLERYGD